MSKTNGTREKLVAYTASEAARELGVSPTQVYRLLERGVLRETALVAGSSRFVSAESVERYKRKREERDT